LAKNGFEKQVVQHTTTRDYFNLEMAMVIG